MTADLKELLPIITEELDAGGSVRFKPRGQSMLPFLVEGRDEVVLTKREPKMYDIAFYRRDDGAFVLHRVVSRDGNIFTMCGDNQYIRERGVRRGQIIAVADGVFRRGKYLSASSFPYRVWGTVWVRVMFCKGVAARAYHKIGRILKRMLKHDA